METLVSKNKSRFALGLALLVGLAMGTAQLVPALHAQVDNAPKLDQSAIQHAKALSTAFRNVAEIASPSVVTISTKTKSREVGMRGSRENPFKGTPFEEFGEQFKEFDRNPSPRRESGMGSGIVIDAAGIILTNRHVVNGADDVIIKLSDGREFKASEVKTDELTDLAVLRITGAKGLKAAKLGDSEAMEIGDWVVAVGNPFGLELTVTSGIISGKGRGLSSASGVNFLQTDAAINPGNSGGPLFNLDGEVVGINTAIATSSGGYQGVGFAIPANLAKWVSRELLDNGHVRRAYLGVGIQDMDSEIAQQFGVSPNAGVLVTTVYPKSPADEAGLKKGDIITQFANKRVDTPRGLTEIVQQLPFGTKHVAKVLRDGKPLDLTVTAKSRPTNFGLASHEMEEEELQAEEAPKTAADSALGLEVSDVTPDAAQKLGFKDQQGVLITRVAPNSPAAEAGLETGMLIREVASKPVKNAKEFEQLVGQQSLDKGVLMLVSSPRGGSIFVVVKE